MRILGLSAHYHDSAAALVVDGRVVAAAQEERFSRIRHDAAFPEQAVRWCLAEAGLRPAELDRVVFYDKPFLKFERLLETSLAFAPRGFTAFRRSMPAWLGGKLFQKERMLRRLRGLDATVNWDARLLFSEHHLSHAASAFYPSPFDEAVVLTLDGVGEWATTSVAIGRGRSLEMVKELHFPHSLGLFYSAVTHYLGFRVNSAEYKVMGLAPYGRPRYRAMMLDHLIDLKPDGTFRLDQRYFDYCTGLHMTNDRFAELFGRPRRRGESEPLEPFHMDMAASVQAVTEEVMLRLTRALAAEYGIANLCLAGGVALNCVANGKVLRDGAFRRLWVQPAAGDAGGALGAALAAWHLVEQGERVVDDVHDGMSGALLGPAFAQADIESRLTAAGARFTVCDDIVDATARELAAQNTVGWFQGRMEFGPRALGCRSILADPRSAEMQSVVNLKVKARESFRPFAPAVRREDVAEWFDHDGDSPYMLLVAEVHQRHRRPVTDEAEGLARLRTLRSDIPAVTHVDCSARLQTVHAETNPRFHALLGRFGALTGCPVLLNTSFNVRGEPIVHTPEQAFRCFMGTGIDSLAIGDCLLRKADQDSALITDHARLYGVD